MASKQMLWDLAPEQVPWNPVKYSRKMPRILGVGHPRGRKYDRGLAIREILQMQSKYIPKQPFGLPDETFEENVRSQMPSKQPP